MDGLQQLHCDMLGVVSSAEKMQRGVAEAKNILRAIRTQAMRDARCAMREGALRCNR